MAVAFRSIFAQSDPEQLAAHDDEVTDALAPRLPKAAELLHYAKCDALVFNTFPPAHWRKTWSNDPLERLNKEIKRRSHVVGIFQNDTAAIRLIGGALANQHDEWQSPVATCPRRPWRT